MLACIYVFRYHVEGVCVDLWKWLLYHTMIKTSSLKLCRCQRIAGMQVTELQLRLRLR
jgi:hypothetical protein